MKKNLGCPPPTPTPPQKKAHFLLSVSNWTGCTVDEGFATRFVGSILALVVCHPGLPQYGPTVEVRRTWWVIGGMDALSECYRCLSRSGPGPDHLREQSALFATFLKWLHGQWPERYGATPKLHQFLELFSSGIVPSDVWNYREEDFGGSLASMARTEGGTTTATSCSQLALTRFCIRQDLPAMRPPQD